MVQSRTANGTVITTAELPPVHSWDEFSQLREVIVGDATGTRIPPLEASAWLNLYPNLTARELAGIETGRFPQAILDEANEDLAELADTLRALGVRVHAPRASDHSVTFGGPGWTTTGFSSYCPRDLVTVLGSVLIESPSPMRARQYETANLRTLFADYLANGACWIAAPRPMLTDALFSLDSDGLPYLTEAETAFEAANILRLGRDILYLVSRSGNEAGLAWLESVVRLIPGDIRVHPLRGVYGYTHIDSTISLLRPGLVLLNPARIRPDCVPAPLHNWDVIWCPEMVSGPLALPHTLSETWIGMNLLMVNPYCAIVDADQAGLTAALEQHKIEVVPLRLRHAQILGGGFHCTTLDIVRESGPERYVD
jgi:glycine amidinotransferase